MNNKMLLLRCFFILEFLLLRVPCRVYKTRCAVVRRV